VNTGSGGSGLSLPVLGLTLPPSGAMDFRTGLGQTIRPGPPIPAPDVTTWEQSNTHFGPLAPYTGN
jgi:hypothetical protein